MPEGHSVHRIARQFQTNFVGHVCEASSPQGRFSDGAVALTGRVMEECFAVGKHMFAQFEDDFWLRVHLGIYGAWDFTGQVTTTLGQTGEYSRPKIEDSRGENSLTSIGAPRLSRVRMAEQESTSDIGEQWPPEPVGAVRLRLLTDTICGDLRGPTACELLDRTGVNKVLDRLGPDPLIVDYDDGERAFIENIQRRNVPIGQLLMDQSVVAGIGNIYRAEILYRAGLDPYTPGKQVPTDTLRLIWADWWKLLRIGVEVGQMMTIDGLEGEAYDRALLHREDRHWVYGRAGEPCRTCGTPIMIAEMQNRKLYWCPTCQK
ncbi:Fpg/Nei family DNA glycosylase [Gulosibacter molinativorax]|uniref:DNA-(apurinic or apyrimidinic site) lyase n=1 Tax=Gulosibacter molinativorax TaxID=256821 RepID=A0ABT7CAE6_9MICO|nr:DNA-formamidopyrimidine glycosylase family protein [Gulosibacter molinativorax]MDJ1371789.1 Fpg/Nei family DNA glycosylase [Gulosibacter molinativorax]QUY60839.1 Endonuclease 8 1 [Gulosibacter molinativorax]